CVAHFYVTQHFPANPFNRFSYIWGGPAAAPPAGGTLSTAPALRFCTPCTKIFSPSFKPSFTITSAPICLLSSSLRCDTLLLSPSTYTKYSPNCSVTAL